MNYNRNTACVHLYMNPDENQNFRPNIYIDGEIRDLKALLVTAARMNDNFYNALFESTQWIMRDELGATPLNLQKKHLSLSKMYSIKFNN